ncbi:hypothetical protein T05_1398 [Trichinella murrelli]|uniref:Uncharacterized protein n=1 Tax=Trichinella murrelli TaxID=144512 RepID=A0A0V0SRF9_9BILA|nr:hypothetical protein T05_1398 [Trichinella murrelli]
MDFRGFHRKYQRLRKVQKKKILSPYSFVCKTISSLIPDDK